MEHFEMHVEDTADLILQLTKEGPNKVWNGLEPKKHDRDITNNDFALIDEMSGLTDFLDNFMMAHNLPETKRDRIRARMHRYSGEKDKREAKQELYMSMFGDQR